MCEEGCNVGRSRRERMIMRRKNMARVGPPHHQWLVIIRELSFILFNSSIDIIIIFAFQWRRDLERGKNKRFLHLNHYD